MLPQTTLFEFSNDTLVYIYIRKLYYINMEYIIRMKSIT